LSNEFRTLRTRLAVPVLRALLAVVAGAPSLSAAQPAQAQAANCPNFQFLTYADTPAMFGRPTVGDFNGDGKPDIALLDGSPSTILVMLGDGTGGFVQAGPATSTGVTSAQFPVTADFNRDGKLDLAVVSSAGEVVTLLGNGAGGFAPASTPIANAGSKVIVSDVDLDGNPDLVALSSAGVRILRGDGSGSFSVGALLNLGQGGDMAVADFNVDGRPDIVRRISEITVYFGDGLGGFAPSSFTTPTQFRSMPYLFTADFDLDGKPDVWQWYSYSDRFEVRLGTGVWFGDGIGAFPHSTGLGWVEGWGMGVADFNGDGRPDVASATLKSGFVVNPPVRNLLVHFGLDGRTFRLGYTGIEIQPPPRSANLQSLIASDLDLNGFPDLVMSGPFGSDPSSQERITVRLQMNACGATTAVTVSSSPNPSAPGQTVTLSSTVTPIPSPGAGTVQFRDGDKLLGSPVPVISGVATLSIALPEGVHQLSAGYLGGGGVTPAQSSTTTHTVLPRISVNDVTARAAETTKVFFQVSLSPASSLPVSVNYATSDGTAKAGVDYTSTSGSLSFAPGTTQAAVEVTIKAQSATLSRAFFLTLTAPVNAGLGKASGAGNIINSVPGTPAVYVDDPSVREGNTTGITLLGFNVRLSEPSSSPITVDFATADGSAIAGTDYVAKSGTVTFAPGKTVKAVLVPIKENTLTQANRTVLVNLASSDGVSLAKAQGTGTIIDDDPVRVAETIDQFRLYSPVTGEHLYTTDTNEYAVLGTMGWAKEGKAYRMFKDAGSFDESNFIVPVYRLYHAGILQHHWTASANEASTLASLDWDYEGIAGYMLSTQKSGTVPLYRLMLAQPPLHLWTTDENEKTVLSTQRGWAYEGILGYVIP
jgi:hypothetical protein